MFDKKFNEIAIRKIINLVKNRYECVIIFGGVATLFNGENYITVNSRGEQSDYDKSLLSKKIDQFVILEKNGSFRFSQNLPLIEEKAVVGVFNCLDSIIERDSLIRYTPIIDIQGFTIGKDYKIVSEAGTPYELYGRLLLIDDCNCHVIVQKEAFKKRI